MMIVDLETNVPPEKHYEVCIVGGGAAGMYLAKRLSQLGLETLVVDAGPTKCRAPQEMGFECDFEEDIYHGATNGRAFGLGGSTSRWGGLLVPHSQRDVMQDGGVSSADVWEHVDKTIRKFQPQVLTQLGYRKDPQFDEFAAGQSKTSVAALTSKGIDTVSSLFLPFRKKNLFGLLSDNSSNSSLTILSNAFATNWEPSRSDTGKFESLTVRSRNHNESTIRASKFVIAAGAIESTRILLEIKESFPTRSLISNDLGKYLGDHLSLAIAHVDERDVANIINLWQPRFEGDWMRSFRFILNEEMAKRPAAFAHFIFESQDPGFLFAKKILSSLQARRLPTIGISECVKAASGLFRLAFDRYCRKRLFVSASCSIRLQLDIEQSPNPQNTIRLGKRLDRFGRRIPSIAWGVRDADFHAMRAMAQDFIRRWNATDSLPTLQSRLTFDSDEKPHDAYHPVGTCRMGFDCASVVDSNLLVRGMNNLWCLSTAVLPTAGTANPTFTMLCLGEGLIQHLARK